MRVIIKNNRIKCSRCGSLLEFEPTDIEYAKSIKGNSHHYLTCPVCKEHIRLGESFTTEKEASFEHKKFVTAEREGKIQVVWRDKSLSEEINEMFKQ